MRRLLHLLEVILISLFFIGCTSTKYVEVPVDRIKIEYRDRVTVDTILSKDSVILKQTKDTVYYTRYRYIYKTKEVKDTVIKQDTVTVTKTIQTIKTENNLYSWQKILMVLGGAGIAYSIIRIGKKLKSWI